MCFDRAVTINDEKPVLCYFSAVQKSADGITLTEHNAKALHSAKNRNDRFVMLDKANILTNGTHTFRIYV